MEKIQKIIDDNIINYEPIKIKHDELEYDLNIKSKGEIITFSINVKKQLLYDNYIRTMNFKEIKELNKVFYVLNSFNDFYDYLKSLSDKEKLNIRKSDNKISIIIYLEVLFKQENVEMDLFIGRQDTDLNMQIISNELFNIKEKEIYKINEKLNKEVNNLRKEIEELNKKINKLEKEGEQNQKIKDKVIDKKLDDFKNEISLSQKNIIIVIISLVSILIISLLIYKIFISNPFLEKINNLIGENNKLLNRKIENQNKEINNLKNEIKSLNKIIEEQSILLIYLSYISTIKKLGEENFIFSEIEKRMNKPIKGLNKLYQANFDGWDPINFHKKCDNIPNTLILIKSEGLRSFGGFTPIPWKSEDKYIEDTKNQTFIFSLDNKNIFNIKNINLSSVYHNKDYGPCFGFGDIEMLGNPIKEYKLCMTKDKFEYKGDEYPPSKSDDNYNDGYIKAVEFEVFQVLFD